MSPKRPALIKLHKAGNLDMPLSTLAISVAVSGIVGFFVIAFFLRYLKTRTLKVFIVYRAGVWYHHFGFGIIFRRARDSANVSVTTQPSPIAEENLCAS